MPLVGAATADAASPLASVSVPADLELTGERVPSTLSSRVRFLSGEDTETELCRGVARGVEVVMAELSSLSLVEEERGEEM